MIAASIPMQRPWALLLTADNRGDSGIVRDPNS